jgi:hypothetical protein
MQRQAVVDQVLERCNVELPQVVVGEIDDL